MIRDVHLDEYLKEASTKEFVWGKYDCLIFCAEWVKLATRKDYIGDVRGQYTSEIGAMRFLIEKHGTMENAIDSKLKRVNINFAQKGDVALCLVDERKTCGIVGARGVIWFKTEDKGVVPLKPVVLQTWSIK